MTALTTEARLGITASVTGLGYKVYTSTPPVPCASPVPRP